MALNTSRYARYGALAYGCLITFLILTRIAIVTGRASRQILKTPFGADDSLAYLAYVCMSLIIDFARAITKGIDVKWR
jgi:hypothetical protein